MSRVSRVIVLPRSSERVSEVRPRHASELIGRGCRHPRRVLAYYQSVRTKRFVLLAGLVASVAVPVAVAATIDRVVVGVPGRNDTRGFSSKLVVEVMVEPD